MNNGSAFASTYLNAAGTLDISGTPVQGISNVQGAMESLVIDDTTRITSMEITGGNGAPFHYLKSFSADGSALKSLNIQSGAKLEELSASDVNLDSGLGTYGNLAFIIEGQALRSIDLSNAGLYGKNWKIGSFEFRSSRPNDNIDGLVDEYPYGMALSEVSYLSYNIYDIRREEDRDDEGTVYYYWEFEVDAEEVEAVKEKSVDWKEWGLDNLTSFTMYGNGINYRYFIGARDITIGEAVDSNLITEDMITFAPRKTTVSGYVSNSAFASASESEKNKVISTLGSYASVYLVNGVYRVTGYNSATASSTAKGYISKYFTKSTFVEEENISSFVNGEWRSASFKTTTRNQESTATFSTRFGTKLWKTDGDDYDTDSTTFVIHNKWKAKAGLTGWLSKESEGYLTLKSIGLSSVNQRLSWIQSKDGVGTQTLKVRYDKSLESFTNHNSSCSMSNANGVAIADPRNELLTFQLYDQTTQNASHNGVAVIYPYGE